MQKKEGEPSGFHFAFYIFDFAFPRALVIFLLTLLLATASCRRSEIASSQNSGPSNANNGAGETSRTPPFSTKEPERYQAVRFTSTSTDDAAESGIIKKTVIARDGERRREDYETVGGTISFLQLPNGTYLLLPEKKLYAELKPDGSSAPDVQSQNAPPVYSTDKLLNEERPEARYEKLGAETLNGREAVKWRVTLPGKTGASADATIENLIWVDESLGMPIKSEMTVGGRAKYSMELRDIKETVDPGAFDLPADYKRVEAGEIFAQMKPVKNAPNP